MRSQAVVEFGSPLKEIEAPTPELTVAAMPLTAEVATRFLEERLRMRSTQLVRHVREWARQQR